MVVVQYVILRKDLVDKYGEGAVATQAAHASVAPITELLRGAPNSSFVDIFDDATQAWIKGTFTKIVLEVPNETALREVEERLRSHNITYVPIRESRFSGELTALGLRPYEKSEVATCLRGLPLFGNGGSRTCCVVNDVAVPIDSVGYSVQDIDQWIPDPSNRFVLKVTLDLVVSRFGKAYGDAMSMRSHGGTGDDYVDSLDDINLAQNLRKNHPAFAHYLLTNHYEDILRCVLKPGGKKSVIITSIDGLFSDASYAYVTGGCNNVTKT